MIRFRFRPLLAIVAILGLLALMAAEIADARPGRSGSFGSRGSRTYTPPPVTNTAPTTARPMERSMTQPGQPGAVGRTAAPAAQPGGFFNRPGLLGGLAAGLLGAGLFGMLFGNGMFGGLGGIASMFGLLLQLALIGGVAYLILRWWRNRQQPAGAYAGGPSPQPMQSGMLDEPLRRNDLGGNSGMGSGSALGGLGGLAGGAGGAGYDTARAGQPSDEVGLTPADFDTFERLLSEVQTAYGREDLATLRRLVTPEMLSYFSEELSENASRGVINEISDVKLLKGDLAEAWREGDKEYATVAMHYQLRDRVIDRATGKVVEGGDEPQEVTELWTFLRSRGGSWVVSAIQQV